MDKKELIDLLRSELSYMAPEAILDSASATQTYGPNTLGPDTPIDGAIKINKREQIGQLLALANSHGFCICPLSTGSNWGFGSVNPVANQQLIVLDLSPLKTISEIDKGSGLIAIEPGVTQRQLAQYLEDNEWDFITPTTGAGPNCSILSNAIERGYGPSPYVDHFSAVTSMRYYIPHPDYCLTENVTAISSMDKNLTKSRHSKVDAAHKYGIGPYLDGLVTQSNLGIVTEISLRLGPAPEKFCSFFIKCKDDKSFGEAVTFTKRLLMDKKGELGIVNIMDKRRVCVMTAGNPNDKSLHQNMTEAQIDSIAGKHGIAEWLIMGSLYATKDSIKATKKYIKSKATFASEVMFSDSLSIKLGLLLTKYVMKSKKTQLDLFQLSTDIMLGKPNQVALPLAYWRNPKVEPNIYNALNPAKDKCGLLWYAPLVPMNATNMRKFIDFIRETTPKYNIEPLITFSCLSAGYLDATVPIIFNASDPNAIEKAHACVDELFDGGIKKGFVPYRLSTKMQATKLDSEAPHWKVTKLIKQALDPNSIISPGRYNPT